MRHSLFSCAVATCLFLLVVAAKWAVLDRYGSAMPDWDQWDAEAVELFIPWFEKDNFLSHLIHPHNEHRVILTKLQNLALALLNGQWDSRLEAVSNAMLHAALAVAFWALGRCAMAPRWHAPLFLVIAALFALPFAWQNVLGGFHSQQYWLVLLSFAAIATVPYARSWSGGWWLGVTAAALALGSMGSGLIAAAVVILVMAWRIVSGQTTIRAAWPALLFMGAIVAFGLFTRVEVPWHADMKARSLSDYYLSIVHSLQWPFRDANWAAAVLWIPWLVVVWRVVSVGWKSRPAAAGNPPDAATWRHAEIIAALGGWTFAQVVATAYARGAGADYPASRYMDTLAFGTAANALALGWMLTHGAGAAMVRIGRYALALGWVVPLAVGLHRVTTLTVVYELPGAKSYYLKAEGHMRRYLVTNDPQALAYPDIPFPSAEGLVERLANPSLRQLMPVPIRAPLTMTAASDSASAGFEENNAMRSNWENPPQRGLSPQTMPLDFAPTWGSYDSGNLESRPKTWRSAPLTSPLGGWLRFETAGDVHAGTDGVRLELQDATTGEVLARVSPSRRPGDTWRSAYVRAPDSDFVIAATDTSSTEWLAFSPPVEMGTLSYLAWQATRHGRLLLHGTAAALLGLALLSWIRRRDRGTNVSGGAA